MRSGSRQPLNRRYFHKRPRIDGRNMILLKKKLDILEQKRIRKRLEDEERKKQKYTI